MAITEQMGDKDFAMVRVWPCLKGSVLDCLMWTSMWLGEWELGSRVMSGNVRKAVSGFLDFWHLL